MKTKGSLKLTKSNKAFYKNVWFWVGLVGIAAVAYFITTLDISGDDREFEADNNIHAYTREIGSGTRSAFTDITGLVDENGDDNISPYATVQNTTNGSMQAVVSDVYGISYISLGSLNDTVKAIAIEGAEPSVEEIQSENYKLVRNFSVVYGQELSEVAQDFWNYMFSAQAQELVAETGYVPVDANAPEYEAADLSGNISIVGSTSVEPTISRFAEEYTKLNPGVTIDITSPGSGAGITSAIDGSSDIGMTSRDPDEGEMANLIESKAIAIDGIVAIVNNNNPVDNLSLDQIQGIYLNYYETWDEVLGE